MRRQNFVFCLQAVLSCSLATCLATKHCHTESGRCYWLGDGTTGRVEAEFQCQNGDGHLAVIETEELWNFVIGAFR